MIEEFKEEYPEDYKNNIDIQKAFNSGSNAYSTGFQSYKSDSVDYMLEHHNTFPLTMVLFYDSSVYDDGIIRNLTCKIFDVFVYKYEKKFQVQNFNIKGGTSTSEFNKN